MRFVMMAELLLGLLANGVRFYATMRYIDFFVSREKCRWRHDWILYVIGCVGTYAVSVVFVSPGLNVVSNILAILLLILPYEIKLSKKLLMVFSIYVIGALADVIVVQVMTRYVSGEPVESVYHIIISMVILMPTAFLKNSQDREKDASLPLMNEVILSLIPLVSIVCIHRIAVLTDNNKPVVLTTAFSLMVINIFLFYLYHILTKFYVAQMNEKRLEQMLAVYEHQLDVMQESQEHIKKLRHDMKHHMIELSAMAEQSENRDMVHYLKQMEDFMLNPAEKVSTGNKDIDGVLNYMLRRADKLLNTVDIDIQIPQQLYSKNFSICAILGNLVDNGVRESSSSDEKYLAVSMRMQKDILLILVENSYAGTVVVEENKFKTTQKDTAVHGLGLESVKQVVASCNGDMKIEHTDNRFRVQVMLYLANVV